MIVVLDTNIYLSALIFQGGVTDQIIRLARLGRFECAVSPDILTEFKRILTKKFKFSEKEADEMVDRILAFAKLVYPRYRFTTIKKFDADNRILECAEEAMADYLVIGDKRHILPLKRFRDIQIISPRDFLSILTKRQK